METNKLSQEIREELEEYKEVKDKSMDKLFDEYESVSAHYKTSRIKNSRKIFIIIEVENVDKNTVQTIEEDVQMIIGKYSNKDTYRQKKVIGYTLVIAKNTDVDSLLYTKEESGFSSSSSIPFYKIPAPIGIEAGCQLSLIDADSEVAVIGNSTGLSIQKRIWKNTLSNKIPKNIKKEFDIVKSSDTSDEEISEAKKIVYDDTINVNEINKILRSNKFKIGFLKALHNKYPEKFSDSKIDIHSLSANSEKIDNLHINIDTSKESNVFDIKVEYKNDILLSKSICSDELMKVGKISMGFVLIATGKGAPMGKAIIKKELGDTALNRLINKYT